MALHPVQARDRLGSPNIMFPIGIINAGMDTLVTTVGCDVIIRNSAQFKTGKSQLFHFENAKHEIFNYQETKQVALNTIN